MNELDIKIKLALGKLSNFQYGDLQQKETLIGVDRYGDVTRDIFQFVSAAEVITNNCLNWMNSVDDDPTPYLQAMVPFRQWVRQESGLPPVNEWTSAYDRWANLVDKHYDVWITELEGWRQILTTLGLVTALNCYTTWPIAATLMIAESFYNSPYSFRSNEQSSLFNSQISRTDVRNLVISCWPTLEVINCWNELFSLEDPPLGALELSAYLKGKSVGAEWRWGNIVEFDFALQEVVSEQWAQPDQISFDSWKRMLESPVRRCDLIVLSMTRYPSILEIAVAMYMGERLDPYLCALRQISDLAEQCTIVELHLFFYRLAKDIVLFWAVQDAPVHSVLDQQSATREQIAKAILLDDLVTVWQKLARFTAIQLSRWKEYCYCWEVQIANNTPRGIKDSRQSVWLRQTPALLVDRIARVQNQIYPFINVDQTEHTGGWLRGNRLELERKIREFDNKVTITQ